MDMDGLQYVPSLLAGHSPETGVALPAFRAAVTGVGHVDVEASNDPFFDKPSPPAKVIRLFDVD